MGGHLVIPQNDILYTNEPSMSSYLSWKATFLLYYYFACKAINFGLKIVKVLIMTTYLMFVIGPWKWGYLALKNLEKPRILSAFVCMNHLKMFHLKNNTDPTLGLIFGEYFTK